MSWLHVARNAVLLAAEAFAAGLVVFLGAACASLPGAMPHYAGVGFGLASAVAVALLLRRTGALLSPGGALLRAGLWAAGLEKRGYAAPRYVGLADGCLRDVRDLWVLGDAAMGLAFAGAHVGGAMVGAQALAALDKSGLLAASVHAAPFGNLAGRDGSALLGAWLLNTAVLTAQGAVTGRYDKAVPRLATAPVVMGFCVFVAVMASQTLGVGSVLSLAGDLALAVAAPAGLGKLWISAVAQVAAAASAFVLVWAVNVVDRAHRAAKHRARLQLEGRVRGPALESRTTLVEVSDGGVRVEL